jgi:hypothetical protein
MQELVLNYQHIESECDGLIQKYQEHIGSKTDLITQRDQEFAEFTWWQKSIYFVIRLYRNSRDQSVIRGLESAKSRADRRKSDQLNDLILQAGRRLMLQTPEVSGAILGMESDHTQLKQLQSSLNQVYQAGKKALREIQEAQSSVSSAQTMEVFDMATSNKGISLISTMSNSSASGDIDDAKRAVKAFNARLESHQQVVTDMQGTTAIEYMDLSFDLFFGGALDLAGSVMSLFALSSASDKLDDAERQVKRAIQQIEPSYQNANQQLKQHEEEMLSFKKEQRLRVIPVLASHGVEVTEDRVQSINALYADV